MSTVTLDDRAQFIAWFIENYPPDSIITTPAWHAEKIWRHVDLGARSGGVSERALIEARREGYRVALHLNNVDRTDESAELVFPMPTTRRPLRVTLSNGTTWSFEPRDRNDSFPFLCHTTGVRSDQVTANKFLRSAYDYDCFSHIIRGETEEVEADEPAPAPCSSRGSLNDVQGINGIRY